MSLVPLILVVLAALIHATWNLLAKRAASAGPAFVLAYNVVASVVYLPWVIWLLATREQIWSWPIAFCLLASAAIHLGYSLCLQRGYQVADLSVVYPIARGTGPLMSSIGAFILLREPPTSLGVLGLVAVVVGIGCISTQGNLAAFRQPKGQEGVRWGFATGSLIASYTVVDGYGVKVLGIHPVLVEWFSNFLRLFMLAPLLLRNPGHVRKAMQGHWGLAVGVGVFAPLSYILVLTAVDMGAPLSLVAPAREMSMMIGAIFGMLILREPVNIWRAAGCATIIAGVVLLGTA